MAISDAQKELIIKKSGELSAGQIARMLGHTRNAVRGVIHRHRQKNETDEQKAARKVRELARKSTIVHTHSPKIKLSQPKIILEEAEPESEPEPEPLGPDGDFAPSGTCQYTKDDPATHNWQMCGHPASKEHRSWCDWHWENRSKGKTKPKVLE